MKMKNTYKNKTALIFLAVAVMVQLISMASAKPYIAESFLEAQGLSIVSESYNDAYWIPQFSSSVSGINLEICNVDSNGWPIFHDAEGVVITSPGSCSSCDGGDEYPCINVAVTGKFDGIKFLSGVNFTQLEIELEYMPVSYQTGTYDQKWGSNPYFSGDKLYLYSGAGNVINSIIDVNDNNPTTQKFVGFGDLTGVFSIESIADQDSIHITPKGVGYANLYLQYAPEGYNDYAFIDTYSNAEHVQLLTTTSSSGVTNVASSVIGLMNGMKPLPLAGSNVTLLSLELELEYMPVSYQTGTYDRKWRVEPSFDGNKLKLFSGSGNLITGRVEFEEIGEDNNLSLVGLGPTMVGVFTIENQVFAWDTPCEEGASELCSAYPNSRYNYMKDSVKGVGYADSSIQFEPSDRYGGTSFMDSYSHGEHIQLNTATKSNPGITGAGIVNSYFNSNMIGVYDGMKPLLDNINFTYELELEYMPTSYQTGTYDQKWRVDPSFDGEKLRLASGAGNIITHRIELGENDVNTRNKIVGFGDFVGTFSNEESISLDESVGPNYIQGNDHGVGYMNYYVQYAPNGYEDNAFIEDISHAEYYICSNRYSPKSTYYSSQISGLIDGAEPLPFADVSLNQTLDLEYMPVGNYDSKWYISPNRIGNELFLISRGTGNIIDSNFEFSDSNSRTGGFSFANGVLGGDWSETIDTDDSTYLNVDMSGVAAIDRQRIKILNFGSIE